MILGVSTTKSAVIIAETEGHGALFAVIAIRPIPFRVESGNDLVELLQSLTPIFARHCKRPNFVIALLKCSSGRFGSCLEAIKAEAVIEIAASQNSVDLFKVAPQSLKKALTCASDQKWRDRAAELFNSEDQHDKWSKGHAGAVSVAFKVAAE